MKVLINKLNLLTGPSVVDATTKLDVSESEIEKTSSCPLGKVWCWNEDKLTFELIDSPYKTDLRFVRAAVCFPIINRSYAWYRSLTSEQEAELDAWYHAWLDVTETGVIPEKPAWLD